MNLILFSLEDLKRPLSREDPRAEHILSVLNTEPGQTFDVGQFNGPRGKATLISVNSDSLNLSFIWDMEILSLYPIDLWVSFCRPQTCRRVLQECTSLGVRSITFFYTEKCEPSYRDSRLWSTGEAERLLIRGAEQAFCTQVPELGLDASLQNVLAKRQRQGTSLALDNYESTETLGRRKTPTLPVTLAVGGERGWSSMERHALRDAGFSLVDLGSRILRTETACIAAISILRIQISEGLSHP
ncbi:MAG: RsmE family RNA methyltransferase [Verrucomicrobia bacterium]|nr:RsmE family RNA methyltransferase [Verrucomicrobiota bacterium]